MERFDRELTERWRRRMPKDVRDRFAGAYPEGGLGDGCRYMVAFTEDYKDCDRVRGGEYPVRSFKEAVEYLRDELSPAEGKGGN